MACAPGRFLLTGMSTHSLPSACLLIALGSQACGPSVLDTGSETQSATDDSGSTATTSSSSQPPDPTTGAPTSEADPTGTPDTTTGEPPDTTTGEPPDTTTGEPIDCPKGQTPFAARWATVVQQPEFKGWGVEGIAARADGTIALLVDFDTEEGPRGYGVILLSKDGELLGTHVGPLRDESPVLAGIAPEGADGWVVLGGWLADTPMAPFLGRFAGDGGFVEEVAPGLPHDVWDAKLGMLDTPVLFGRNFVDDTFTTVGTKIAADGVGTDWTAVIDPSPMGLPLAIASDEVGQVLFVTGSGFGDGPLLAHVVDSAGQSVWSRTIEAPFSGVVHDAVAFPGGWAVLGGGGSVGPVRLLALAAADGATLWGAEVAADNEDGSPLATRVHVIGDRLTLPVVRTLDFEELDGPHTAAAHRLGFDGAPVDETPLWEATLLTSQYGLASAVGACGELVTMSSGNRRVRVGAYVP